MRYDFDQKIAKIYGVEEAIMYANIVWWCHKNATERSVAHFKDGHYWTWNTEEAWAELFGFWTIKQVSRILANLERGNLLASGAFNKKGYDRTKWYRPVTPEYKENLAKDQMGECINPNGIMQKTERADAFAQTGAPIPDNKAQIENTDKSQVSIDTAPKAQEKFGNPLVNDLISAIKEVCNSQGWAYEKTMDRKFANHIVTAKDFASQAETVGLSPQDYAIQIVRASALLDFWAGKVTGPKAIYQHHSKIYNAAKEFKRTQHPQNQFQTL
jgi:hypothetical protein